MYNLFFLNFIQVLGVGHKPILNILLSEHRYIPSLPDLALDLMMSDRHFLQTLCEHGSMRGSAYSSRHTGHVRSSSILKYDRSVHNSYNDTDSTMNRHLYIYIIYKKMMTTGLQSLY